MIFIVVGLGIGLVASFYYISHSLSSLSAEPPAVTVEHLLTLTTYDQLQELRDAKLTELTAILQRITDGQSAREHLSAAQHSFMQIEMIDARIRMFPAHTEAELQSRSQPTEAAANLREECMRLAKSFGASRELRSVLNPLSTQFRITEVTPPPSPSPSPSIVVLNQLSAIHSQFELYKLQHLDKYPDLRNLGWKCLTQRTTSAGALIAPDEFLPAHLVFGPYLPSEPQNPLANSSQIIFSAGPPAPGFKATTRAGFLYDESRGRVWALNADGTLFNEATARARADAR